MKVVALIIGGRGITTGPDAAALVALMQAIISAKIQSGLVK